MILTVTLNPVSYTHLDVYKRQLVDGVTQLRDGSGELKDGIEKLNDEGIQKIVDLFDGDLGTLVTRLRALADVAGDYNNYSGLSDDMTGTVKSVSYTHLS